MTDLPNPTLPKPSENIEPSDESRLSGDALFGDELRRDKKERARRNLRYELIFLILLVIGAYFRLVGWNWGEYTYMHPDERFLIWVGADIQPVGAPKEQLGAPPNSQNMPERKQYGVPDCKAWGGYFDAACSPLNPNNRGHGFYVYGTLPMFLTRYVVQYIYGHSGFDEMTNVGRLLSAFADLLTVLLVYLIALRLFDRRVGVLAAAFSAATVLQIQQSHFFTTDTFITFFTILALYFAVRIGTVEMENSKPSQSMEALEAEPRPKRWQVWIRFVQHPYFVLSILFGLSLGMAVASKLNAAPMAAALPAALLIRLTSLPPEKRRKWLWNAVLYTAIGAFFSILAFRVFQPYAFSGPGFFGLKPNPLWVQNIAEQRAQAAGDIDLPFALQWSRRSHLFSGTNLVLYGVGLPLGILAWAGFLVAGWRILKGDWQRQALIWSWTGLYFLWQSLQSNPTMRYQLPIYPTLAIFAGWVLVFLWDHKRGEKSAPPGRKWQGYGWKITAVGIGMLALAGTFAWAWAFSGIYTRPFTRVAGSRWIYQNVPGPVNLHIQTEQGLQNQILAAPYGIIIQPGLPFYSAFQAKSTGTLQEITLAHVFDKQTASNLTSLNLVLSASQNGSIPLGNSELRVTPASKGGEGSSYLLTLVEPLTLLQRQHYYLIITDPVGNREINLCSDLTVYYQDQDGPLSKPLSAPPTCAINSKGSFSIPFQPENGGKLNELYFSNVKVSGPAPISKTLEASISEAGQDAPLATGRLVSNFLVGADGLGAEQTIQLDQPVPITKGKSYQVQIKLISNDGTLALQGANLANEGDWDDGLPLRIDGYDGFGGIYPTGLNFNMYTDDNPDKLARFTSILDQTEYIAISSSRQWGSLPRISERYPMVTVYYRNLLGCPDDKEIGWCYSVAKPGMFKGKLGYDLVEINQSNPAIGPFSVNTQFAEEAFTVYDHPKVLIFHKTKDYDPLQVRSLLGAVDFTETIHITPKKAGPFPANLLLPIDRLTEQLKGGTWSQIFNFDAIINKYEPVGVLVWYLTITLLGLLVYPLVRLALPGLPDRGYPLARISGMLILAYFVWLAGSYRIPFSRLTITVVLALMALAGLALAYLQRQELKLEWRERKRYFLMIEALALAFFLLFLFVRLGNSDLWHPWKGGEKPMDFSYFNAVLKSTTFPPYDPWFTGGYLNYYYYGFVLVGVPVKWLGLVPSFAYNLILPSMFSLVGLGAFSAAWNLVSHQVEAKEGGTSIAPVSLTPTPLPGGEGKGESAEVETAPIPRGEGEEGRAEAVQTSVQEGTTLTPSRSPSTDALPGGEGKEGAVLRTNETEAPDLGGASLTHARMSTNDDLPGGISLTPAPVVSASLRPASSDALPVGEGKKRGRLALPFWAGLAAALLMVILGNLGTMRMIYRGFQMLADPEIANKSTSLLTQWSDAAKGFGMAVTGSALPYSIGDWYWIPSRVMAAGDNAITEFPGFTFIYADPHAHLFAMPVALLCVSWALALVLGKARWRNLGAAALCFLLGGIAIGSMKPINTWDFPTYLALGLVALVYASWRSPSPAPTGEASGGWEQRFKVLAGLPPFSKRLLIILIQAATLVGLAVLLYQPYNQWYGQGYNSVEVWKGPVTSFSSYFTHWGLFLFIIAFWLAVETRNWMAETPVSALRKLDRYWEIIWSVVGALFVIILVLVIKLPKSMVTPTIDKLPFGRGAGIALVAIPLAAWAGLLLLRPGMPDAKRAVLFMVGTGLTITVLVEVIVLRGDIGRQNTVFKLYLQSWTLFSICAAAAFAWMLPEIRRWKGSLGISWQVILTVLVFCAAMFPIMGGLAKIKDRMAPFAPHTLDGMDYMQYAQYDESGTVMNLDQDYKAIRWMQDNVQGSPVIVEANSGNLYRWYTRYTIYTGLPNVVGWEWHQQQQRSLTPPDWVRTRLREINQFYLGGDPELARQFLQKYNVSYIIVGQLERITYPGTGLDKFSAYDGTLWKQVYSNQDTQIYEVIH